MIIESGYFMAARVCGCVCVCVCVWALLQCGGCEVSVLIGPACELIRSWFPSPLPVCCGPGLLYLDSLSEH